MNGNSAHSASNSERHLQAQIAWDYWRRNTPHPGQVMLADVWPFLLAAALMMGLLFIPEISVRTTVVTGIAIFIFLFITETIRNKRKWADTYLRKTFNQTHPQDAAVLWPDGRVPPSRKKRSILRRGKARRTPLLPSAAAQEGRAGS